MAKNLVHVQGRPSLLELRMLCVGACVNSLGQMPKQTTVEIQTLTFQLAVGHRLPLAAISTNGCLLAFKLERSIMESLQR